MATIVPIRIAETEPSLRGVILEALREHGALISLGPTRSVYELSFDTEDAARLRRCVIAALEERCPGWQHRVRIFWPE